MKKANRLSKLSKEVENASFYNLTPKSADGLGGRPHIALDTTLRTRLGDIFH